MKQFKTAGMFLLVLLILGGIAYWDEQKTSKEAAAKKEQNKVFSIAAEDVQEIHFESDVETGRISVDAKLQDGKWFVTAPVQELADDAMIKRLIQTLTSLKYQKVGADSPGDLSAYGITESAREVILKTKDEQVGLRIGEKAPVGFSVYFMKNDDQRVFLGSQILLTATEKKLRDFRSKSLANIDFTAIQTLEYEKTGQEKIVVSRDVDQFKIKKPIQARADSDQVEDLFLALNAIKVENFIDAPGATLRNAFLKSFVIIRWSTADNSSTALRFVEHDGGLWASYNPLKLAFRLSADTKTKIDKSLHKLRDRTLVGDIGDSATSIDIDGKVYEKSDDNWFLKGSESQKKASKSHIRDLIVDLEFAKADELLSESDGKRVMTTPPKHRLEVGLKDKKIVIDLWANEKNTTQYFVRSSERTGLMLVATKHFESLHEKKLAQSAEKSVLQQ